MRSRSRCRAGRPEAGGPRIAVLFLFCGAVAATVVGCASSKHVTGTVLRATVVSHEIEPFYSARRGINSAGEGLYYLDFEVATPTGVAHYRYEVTRRDYLRYQDGDVVEMTIVDGNLRDLRPARD